MELQRILITHSTGTKFEVFLTQYEIKRIKEDSKFRKELIEKYYKLHKQNLIRPVQATPTVQPRSETCRTTDFNSHCNYETICSEQGEQLDFENSEPTGNEINLENKYQEVGSEGETLCLIKLYGENEEDMKHAKKKKYMWQIIAEKMMSQAFLKYADRCQRKWWNLARVYRNIKDQGGPKKSGRGRMFFKYFEILDEILGHRPSSSNETYVLDTLAEDVSENASTSTVEPRVNHNSPLSEVVNASPENNSEHTANIEKSNRTRRIRSNYTQEYFKVKINSEKLKDARLKDKIKRHEERMRIENKKIEMEQQKLEVMRENLQELRHQKDKNV